MKPDLRGSPGPHGIQGCLQQAAQAFLWVSAARDMKWILD